MKVALCLLVLGGVMAEAPRRTGAPMAGYPTASTSSGSSNEPTATKVPSAPWYSFSGSSVGVDYSGNSDWGSVSGSGSGWQDAGWDYDSGWDAKGELWHFRPMWNWDSPYPPEGTTYRENWGTPPSRDLGSRRSFYFETDNGISLMGATADPGRAGCNGRDWCIHLTFHSSYGVLSDFDAFVLDHYDSKNRVDGIGFWDARERGLGSGSVLAPLVLGGFSPEERAVLQNISDWGVENMAKQFNDSRTTTWTLYPDSDELDVVLSFKQLFTLLPGYPDGNAAMSLLNNDPFADWDLNDQVLLRVAAKRQGSGVTSALLPRVLNFTGSQLFEVEYFSSLEYPDSHDENLTTAPNAMTLDLVFNRRRYGSGIPWDPARPSDACYACDQQVMNHPAIARCLDHHVPESVFRGIYERTANEQMSWDSSKWEVGDWGPSYTSYKINDAVDACFGLRWLLGGMGDDGSWSSDSSQYGDAGDGWASSSGPGYGDAGNAFDDTRPHWSSSWSSSGSSGGPDVGDWPSIRNVEGALSLLRESDMGIQCFVDSRCPVGNRNFAEATGRVIVIEHDPATLRVNFSEPNYGFYLWMELEGLGPEGKFSTPPLSSDHSPGEIAELIASSVPNPSKYNLAVDVRFYDNSDWIEYIKFVNQWIVDHFKSGGSASEAPAAWSSYVKSSGSSSSFQFPSAGDLSASGFFPDAGPNSASGESSSPDAGSDYNSEAWAPEPHPVPDLVFTVEILFRNVSIVPKIVDVFVIADGTAGSAPASMWESSDSDLRFQLAPLNLSTFQYVPPPPYVNLTWDETLADYPDAPGYSDSVWTICSECEYAYDACDSSTSCSIGVRAFLRETLAARRYTPQEGPDFDYSSSRRKWIAGDFGPRLRQSASYFTADGYDLFMNFMACISTNKSSCDLDVPRETTNNSMQGYLAADPTLLEITPARSVFIVPFTSSGNMENIVMKYHGKETLFKWPNDRNAYMSMLALRMFVSGVMNEYDADKSLWPRNPRQGLIQVSDISYQYAYSTSTNDTIVEVTFGDTFFVEDEPPRFKPESSDVYNELDASHWTAVVSAYRNPNAETFTDSNRLVAWPRFENWLDVLSWDPNFAMDFDNGSGAAENIPICHQCTESWMQCFSEQLCRNAMRFIVLPAIQNKQQNSMWRSSLAFSSTLAEWPTHIDSPAYAKILNFFSCLSVESCPVGYALPADPLDSLVPITTKLASYFAVTVPWQESIKVHFGKYDFGFNAVASSASDLEYWLRLAMLNSPHVKVQTMMVDDSTIRYEVTSYPAVADFPSFYMKNGIELVELENKTTFASMQLSSNLVQNGQSVSWDLLNYWFGLSGDIWRMLDSSIEIFNGTQVCHGCPECLEALTRCRNNMDCAASTIEVLVPLLRNTTFPLSTSLRSDGRTLVELDLSSSLLSLVNEAFISREGWLRFAQLLHSMSACRCEVGFGQMNFGTGEYLEPTRILIKAEVVEVRVRIYSNTELDVWFNGNVYSFYPPEMGAPLSVATNNFFSWFSSVTENIPVSLKISEWQALADDSSQSAVVIMNLTEFGDETNSASLPMVNPSWIPTFIIKSNDMSAVPPAEANVTPWHISLQSNDRYPPFDRLLDLLVFGPASDEKPVSSFDGEGSSCCTMCEPQRQACFDDAECNSAITAYLLPTLRSMTHFDEGAGLFSFEASDQFVVDVFPKIQTLTAKQKLLEMLRCTAISSSSTQDSCVQVLSKEAIPGVTANLEFTSAMSTFPINKGKVATVYGLEGSSHYYNDNGDSSELFNLIENDVLGGYATSGVHVQVTADWDVGSYTIRYDGLTSVLTPHLVSNNASPPVDSVDTFMKTKFTASTRDFSLVFSLWMKWLDPTGV